MSKSEKSESAGPKRVGRNWIEGKKFGPKRVCKIIFWRFILCSLQIYKKS